jgi:outer membrane lipopolysaccharide assembly protein LptE/RlpB
MDKNIAKKFLILAVICLSLLHCGYHLRGTGSFLPEHIKKIHIPLFKNFTTRFELDLKLTTAVINELVARGKYEVTSDAQNADAVLTGEIVVFNANPIAFTGEARADRYAITIVARVVLKDNKTQKELFANPYLSHQEEYAVPQGTDFETSETDAITKVAEAFARELVIAILEGF